MAKRIVASILQTQAVANRIVRRWQTEHIGRKSLSIDSFQPNIVFRNYSANTKVDKQSLVHNEECVQPSTYLEETSQTALYVASEDGKGSHPPRLNELDASSLIIIPREKSLIDEMPPPSELKFGHFFSDHMLEVEWDADYGWKSPVIKATQSISMHPATSCLHYGLQAFEGLKAYRRVDGGISLFRPEMNCKRLNSSASRIALPSFNSDEFCKLLKALVKQDAKFVPYDKGYCLYVRPVIFSTEGTLGVAAPNSAKIVVMTTPCGPFYKTGFRPVQLLAEHRFIRAFIGGAGSYKIGGNYAPTIHSQKTAAEKGYSQVLWLLPEDGDYQMTEVGVMNLFIYWINNEGKRELLTPTLEDDLILPGVTRDSVIQLAREMGDVDVVERRVYLKKDFLAALSSDRILEVFGAGTAASICSVDKLCFMDTVYDIPVDRFNKEAAMGPLATRLYQRLTDIQTGVPEHPWVVDVTA